jgi:Putative Flp pilus-assembly TadE/G-like
VRQAHTDRGQAAVLFVVVVSMLFVVSITAVAVVGGRVVDRARAQAAADAAALGSLEEGRADAELLAARHGAVLVSWVRGPGPDEVTVTVRFGTATATARASDAP